VLSACHFEKRSLARGSIPGSFPSPKLMLGRKMRPQIQNLSKALQIICIFVWQVLMTKVRHSFAQPVYLFCLAHKPSVPCGLCKARFVLDFVVYAGAADR